MTARRAWVTGATRNIGLAITERLVADGMAVALNGEDLEETERTCAALRVRGADVLAVPGDISEPEQVEQMADLIGRHWGGLDVLVNNAAVPLMARGPFEEVALDDWRRSLDVNVTGVFLCCRAALPLMTDGGAIVNISSIGASRAHRDALAYDAGKAAVESMTRGLAIDLGPRRIRVNAIAPGSVDNDRFRELDEATRRERTAGVPLGRVGTGADVAGGVSFLAGPDATYITGQVLTVDGGLSAHARHRRPSK